MTKANSFLDEKSLGLHRIQELRILASLSITTRTNCGYLLYHGTGDSQYITRW